MKMLKNVSYSVFLLLSLLLSSCSYTFYKTGCNYPLVNSLDMQYSLSDTLLETSGLESVNSTFYSFNDSDGEAALFLFNDSAELLQKTIITRATNADWEDIAYDGTDFYIADVGNNFASRDTLVIYIVPASELTAGIPQTSALDSISFSYAENLKRRPNGLNSHDCESLLSFGDSLYLFAKDWVDQETRVYVLPKSPGHYELTARTAYPVKALITGADIYEERNEVVLVGYRNFIPLLIVYKYETSPAYISCGGKARVFLRFAGTQVEGVCYDAMGNIFVTSEKRFYKQALYRAY